jgi:hypothetical protein
MNDWVYSRDMFHEDVGTSRARNEKRVVHRVD